MSLRALRTLQAIARHGSFARAGDALGLTQSAVSLQVKALEHAFDATLFDRSRRLPQFTAAGRIILERSEEILALYDQITAALSEEQSLAGRLRLGAVQTALSGVLPDALATLRRAHPRVRVHVVSGMSVDLAAKLSAGDLDAAITTEPVRPHPAGLVWRPLYQESFWFVAPSGYEGRSQRQMLGELPLISFDRQAWAGRVIDRELRNRRLDVRDEMVLDSQEVILKMVGKGLGVAILPLSEEIRAGLALTCLPFGEPQLVRRIVLLERQGHSGGRLALALSDTVAEIMRATPCTRDG